MLIIGNIKYDSQRFELTINNTTTKLEPKVGALLEYFLLHPNRIISKDELFHSLWDGIIVTDNALERLISQLRQVVKSEEDYLCIKTIRKRGYCLEVNDDSQPEQRGKKTFSNKYLYLTSLVLIGIIFSVYFGLFPRSSQVTETPTFSIAVLPFADMSEQSNQQYLADGLTEELLHLLAGIEGTRVASRTSSMVYEAGGVNVKAIAKQLNVEHILEGSVRRYEDKIRVTVQLINAKTDEHLWSHTYDRKMSDIIVLQQDIAYSVVNSLRRMFNLEPFDTAAVGKPKPISALAYEKYLKGKQMFHSISRMKLKKTIKLTEESLQEAEEFVRGWELLAHLYLTAIQWEWDDRNYTRLAQQAIEKVESLDPKSASALALKGSLHRFKFDWQASLDFYNQAIALNNSEPMYVFYRGLLWHQTGFLDKAEADFDLCLKIDPVNGVCMKRKALSLYLRGKNAAALKLFFEAEELGYNNLKNRLNPLLVNNGHRYAVTLHLKVLFYIFERIENFPYTAMLDSYVNKPIDEQSRLELIALVQSKSNDVTESMLMALQAFDLIKPNQTAEGFWYPEYPLFYQSQKFQELINTMKLAEFWQTFSYPPQCKPSSQGNVFCKFD